MAWSQSIIKRKKIQGVPTENQEQRALVKWLSMHPILKDYYCKIDNEGKRTPAQGWNAKLMGLRPGASDLFIYYPCNGYHGLWLEMKTNRHRSPSEMKTETWVNQQAFQEVVKGVGFAAHVCYGFEDAISIIENYLLS